MKAATVCSRMRPYPAATAMRRYLGKKRTYRDQDLGVFDPARDEPLHPLLSLPRFYQEFAGYRDFGAMRNRQPHLFRPIQGRPAGKPVFRKSHRYLPHRGLHR